MLSSLREVYVDLFDVSGREKRATFAKVLVACLMAAVLAPPLAQAAVTTIKGTVKIKDSSGDAVSSSKVDPMGVFQAGGAAGALDVRTYSGGGGFLGTGDCLSATAIPATISVTAPDVATGLIITGSNGTIGVSSEATDALFGIPEGTDYALISFEVDQNNTTEVVSFGNGLTLTSPLKITCTAGNDAQFVLLGM